MIQTNSFTLAAYEQGDPNSEKFALVLPGRLDSKDYAHVRSHVTFLASRGYHVVTFDPPGTWESPGDITDYTLTNYLQAITELIEQYGNRPTLLMGHSRGGSMAMYAGISNPQVTGFVAVMSRATPSKVGLDEAKANGKLIEYRDLPPGTSKSSEPRTFVLPYSFFEDAAQYSSLEALKTCTKPKLRFLGKKDTAVGWENIKQEHELSAEPKMLHELDSVHDYRYDQKIIDEVNTVTGQFLDEYNL